MTFSFYGCLDQAWLDDKMTTYDLCRYEIMDELENYGFEAKQLFESPNPIILAMLNVVINELIDKLKNNYDFTDKLLDNIRELLQETVFVNSIDSHIDADYVFKNLVDDIKQELEDLDNLEQLEAVENLFNEYDF
jgi:hypothetical protein